MSKYFGTQFRAGSIRKKQETKRLLVRHVIAHLLGFEFYNEQFPQVLRKASKNGFGNSELENKLKNNFNLLSLFFYLLFPTFPQRFFLSLSTASTLNSYTLSNSPLYPPLILHLLHRFSALPFVFLFPFYFLHHKLLKMYHILPIHPLIPSNSPIKSPKNKNVMSPTNQNLIKS